MPRSVPSVFLSSVSLWFLSVVLASPLASQEARVEAPASVTVGAEFEVRWQGPAGAQDFLSIDPEGAADSEYGDYVYTRKGSPVSMTAPEEPGRYTVRYHQGGSGYPVLAGATLEVVDATATLETPDRVDAGAELEVRWTGPANARDFISLDPAGAPDRAYGKYSYLRSNPVTLTAPDEPGTYEVRYHLARSYRVLASSVIEVAGVSAQLEHPETAGAGGRLEVRWTGPANARDYISIDPVGAPDSTYGDYAYVARGNPVVLPVPETAGPFEVRYHSGQSNAVLASSALRVAPTSASVDGPSSVPAGSRFEVSWDGPGNTGDYLTIVPVGAGDRDYLDYSYAGDGSPVEIEAPLETGAHELRYVTGRARNVLARRAIEVTPGVVPGTLRVVSDGSSSGGSAGPGAVELILDASGSMLKRLDGERRIELAKSSLIGLVESVVPAGTPFALRVFGHREADSCRTDLELPMQPLDPNAARQRIASIEARNLARTPIAASLRAVADDLAGARGPVTVVLVTDGEETCDGDPLAAVQALRARGWDVTINVVGFAIDEMSLKETFESWARAGGGRYLDAGDAASLGDAMNQAVRSSFEVLRGDEVVAQGTVGGGTVRLAPGRYTVRWVGDEVGVEVTVAARSESSVTLQ